MKVNGMNWIMDCRCLVPAPGEEPDDMSMCIKCVPCVNGCNQNICF